jgi:hypothetical protein
MIYRRIFPEGPHLIDHRQAPRRLPTRNAGRALSTGEWACRMSGLTILATSIKRFSDLTHERPVHQCRAGVQRAAAARGGAVEMPAIHVFLTQLAINVLGRGEVKGLPAQLALLTQNGKRAETYSHCAAGSSDRGCAERAVLIDYPPMRHFRRLVEYPVSTVAPGRDIESTFLWNSRGTLCCIRGR